MKRIAYFTLLLLSLLISNQSLHAQNDNRFSPQKFDAELREYLIREARLTAEEQEHFFPIFNEMQQKQRQLFSKQRALFKKRPATADACRQALVQYDEMDVKLKKLQQTYHQRLLQVIPAEKLYDVIQAESRFHRHKLRQWGTRPKRPNN